MASHPEEVAMLNILVATCETTLDTLRAAANPIDAQLVTDLETMIERSRRELQRLVAISPSPPNRSISESRC
jgi:hypothetical protein